MEITKELLKDLGAVLSSQRVVQEFSRLSFKISEEIDTLGEYKIEVGNLLTHRSGSCCEAYAASHASGGEFVAFVFRRNLPVRLEVISWLAGNEIHNIVKPLDFGIVRISALQEREHFVAILHSSYGRSLKSILESRMIFDEHFIANKFLPVILPVLAQLHQNNIVHGSVNTENIFIGDNGSIVLGDCFINCIGTAQPAFYETIERAQAHKFAKGSGSRSVDYYALGMTIFHMYTGSSLEHLNDDLIISEKLKQGSFTFLLHQESITGRIGSLVGGLSSDEAESRWDILQIDNWLYNKNIPSLEQELETQSVRAIIFNDKEFYSCRSLAYEMRKNWALSKEFLETDKLERWLASNKQNARKSSIITQIKPAAVKSKFTPASKITDDHLTKILIVLDPKAPVHTESFSYHISGTGLFIMDAISASQNELLKILLATITSGLHAIFEKFVGAGLERAELDAMQQVIFAFEPIAKYEIGYGMERLMYDLNPYLTCEDKWLQKHICISAGDVASTLETLEIKLDSIYEHKALICFLYSKFHEKVEVVLRDLQHFPHLYRHRAFRLAALLCLAQRSLQDAPLHNLTQFIGSELEELLDRHLKSAQIRSTIFENIKQAAKTGIIVNVIKAAGTHYLLLQDERGYEQAIQQAESIEAEVGFYNSKRKELRASVRHKSLRFAVSVSSIILCMMFIKILLQIV